MADSWIGIRSTVYQDEAAKISYAHSIVTMGQRNRLGSIVGFSVAFIHMVIEFHGSMMFVEMSQRSLPCISSSQSLVIV